MNNFDSHVFIITIAGLLLLILIMSTVLAYMYFRKKSDIEPDYSEQFQENAYKLLPDAIVILNHENKITYLNLEAESMLDCKLRSVLGKHYNDVFKLLNKETRRAMQGTVGSRSDKDNIKREFILSTKRNRTFAIELVQIQTKNIDARDNRKILVLRDTTEKKALESKLSNLETYDSLTRMLKRKTFDAVIKQLIDNAHKQNSSHVLAYLSIDQFQVINDTIGYSSGDNLITNMAEQIKKHVTSPLDIVGRMGANEFAIVFKESKLPEAIQTVKDILKSASGFNFMSRGHSYSITMSAGFVLINSNSTSSTRAISEANIACNLASKKGGNRVFAYRQNNSELQKLEGNLEWVMILKKALQDNRFKLHAQAIQSLKASEYNKPFHHYELLLRLSDENGQSISPDEFIAAAEYYSLMPTLDRWVVKNAFKQISAIPEQNPLPVFAINLSGQSLNDPLFLNFVREEVKASGVHPQMLCFEITEQVAVEDLSAINNFIASLKALGCSFSLDDFGTGVSSYGYLRSLDVDYLKIDGVFIKHIASDDVAKTMVQSINQVGHTMNLKIIAEYVENEKIVNILRDMGVDYGQGYEIAKPLPIEEVILNHNSDAPFLLTVAG